jgi:hypothetical protein
VSAIAKREQACGSSSSAELRVGQCNWEAVTSELDAYGSAVMEKMLSARECADIASLYLH